MKQNGFTLIELAIALMVIGLLIGGVLKGQELIENAKVTATIRNINSYDAATMIFRNTYNALPGDMRQPTRIPNCTAALCNTPGNGDGQIYDTTEQYNFFPHLTKAGMIQGPEGAASTSAARENFFPTSPFKDLWTEVHYTSTYPNPSMKNYYVFFADDMDAKTPRLFDQKMDDGNALTGKIRPYTSESGWCFTISTGEYLDDGWCHYIYVESVF